MISNYVLQTKVKSLKDRKSVLTLERQQLIEAIGGLGISKQAAYIHKRGGIKQPVDRDLFEIREKYAKRIHEIDKEHTEMNNELRALQREMESDRNSKLLEIFSEIFTNDQMIEIKKEAERRMAGEHPFGLGLNIQENLKAREDAIRYRKMALEQLEKMIEFRLILTGLIEKGCDKFGESAFLSLMSPLNRLIIPVEELKKIKQRLL